ncbi:hypothetical protein B0G71_0075 [Paraburkholderia sp. BL27I4N3]|uniref:hypothetical protein n=1 Tax=Paraburkholderia sp. BL27I4N3 TaxID=1938805 RepID=UPI000E266877|nr:hypothetical protein [Paraburkholderia sp. BL27I4N3]REE17137.1 hypothetical protein B0G71_0075 [Paraburkholderia sp. BL27I4N3]
MKLERQHPQNGPVRAGASTSAISRRSDRGPLFDLPPVEPSQQAAFLRLMSGFHSDAAAPDELDEAVVFRVLREFYEPRRGFWRALEANTVMEAIHCYAPELRAARECASQGGYAAFAWQMESGVFMLQFLERYAERLLDIPNEGRPKGQTAAWQWLNDDCLRRGEIQWVHLMECVGERAVTLVLRMARAIELAPVTTLGPPAERPRRGRARKRSV